MKKYNKIAWVGIFGMLVGGALGIADQMGAALSTRAASQIYGGGECIATDENATSCSKSALLAEANPECNEAAETLGKTYEECSGQKGERIIGGKTPAEDPQNPLVDCLGTQYKCVGRPIGDNKKAYSWEKVGEKLPVCGKRNLATWKSLDARCPDDQTPGGMLR